MKFRLSVSAIGACLMFSGAAIAALPGEGPRLGNDRITQDDVEFGGMSLFELRQQGLRIFSTPFNKKDGYGDGPINPADTTTPGGRPTLQNNGTFLRVNGIDAQTCLECHSIVSNASVPAKLGIGGVGGSVTNALGGAKNIDVDDEAGVGFASYDGRFINPPFLFGSGGVELLSKEMTTELQALKAHAEDNPGVDVALITKGVDFGVIRYVGGSLDTSDVMGVDDDLVVKPFGRKGEFITVRAFDVGAMAFHFGMQSTETVGVDVDDDGDGVSNEIMVGELSALVIFNTNLERPFKDHLTDKAKKGRTLFRSIGCADCHIPTLKTDSHILTYSFPEEPADPAANVYYDVDLAEMPVQFKETSNGGLKINLFADLKRHDMGLALAETAGSPLDLVFTTARLWGVADTAPYMHDGRALTIGEAIDMHAGEALNARNNFAALSRNKKAQLLSFLLSLRTPNNPAAGLVE